MPQALLKTRCDELGMAHLAADAQVFSEQVCITTDINLHLMGVCLSAHTAPAAPKAMGSAADQCAPPLDRALYEALERMALLQAEHSGRLRFEDDPHGVWRMARSNGIALHRSVTEATEHATAELMERDRVLRCWFGDSDNAVAMVGHDTDDADLCLKSLQSQYEIRCVEFTEEDPTSPFHVAGVFALPRRGDLPLFYGLSARRSLSEALRGAAREALQRLGFLWGEAIPQNAPTVAPSALGHQEYYLYPGHQDVVRQWLEEGGPPRPLLTRRTACPYVVTSKDITPSWMAGQFSVIKAECPEAVPLTFGARHPWIQDTGAGRWLIHPIA